ncbi:hypothetical protein EBT25_09390 [bacterium]|nr:hypothetical protein [bacterium]
MPIGFIGPALQGARLLSGAGQLGRYALGLGSLLSAGVTASTAQPNSSSIKNRRIVNPEFLRPDYSGAGERARRFQEYRTGRDIPGASTDYSVRLGGGGGSAADRAYQQEFSRVAQLTAQDPELQRYEAARKLAVAPGATPEQVQSAENIGMQIWQQKYGNTPMGQPGGAVGRFNPLMDRTFGYQSGMSPQEMQAMQATAAPVQVAPGAVPYQKGDLGTRATLETGYDPAAYGLTPEKIEEMKQKLLQQAK